MWARPYHEKHPAQYVGNVSVDTRSRLEQANAKFTQKLDGWITCLPMDLASVQGQFNADCEYYAAYTPRDTVELGMGYVQRPNGAVAAISSALRSSVMPTLRRWTAPKDEEQADIADVELSPDVTAARNKHLWDHLNAKYNGNHFQALFNILESLQQAVKAQQYPQVEALFKDYLAIVDAALEAEGLPYANKVIKLHLFCSVDIGPNPNDDTYVFRRTVDNLVSSFVEMENVHSPSHRGDKMSPSSF